MPKSFLLTNKRYKIWKQIKETFKEEQKRWLLEQMNRQEVDARFDHVVADDTKTVLPFDSSTDYSKYTDVTEEEGIYYHNIYWKKIYNEHFH